jgi:Domain of unknown function (DUF3943)
VLAWLGLVAALWSGDASVGAGAAVVPLDDYEPAARRPALYTALEIGAVLLGGTAWYLRHGTDGSWTHGLQLSVWKRKVTGEDVDFDTDHYNTNAIGHPIDGTVFYQIARGNGFGPGASFIASAFASTFWEYFVELPEHPSLNDLILTPVGGAVIGEATYRLGRYLAVSGSGAANCVGAVLFSPVAALNDRPVCRRGSGLIPTARLELAVGLNRAVFDGDFVRDELALSFGTDIVSQRTYQRPGSGSVAITPGQWAALQGNLRIGENRLDGAWLDATAVWAGRYDRHYRRRAADETDPPLFAGPPEGWGWLLGIGSSFDYRLRDLPRVHDRIATVGVGGPAFELSARQGRALMRLTFNLQYAFGIVGSMAYRAGYATVIGEPIKSPLRDNGYYYAHGVVTAATMTADLGPVGFLADGRGGWYWSIDLGDPAQSTIRRDVLLHDSRYYVTAAMWTRALVGPFRFGLAYQHVWRNSAMADTAVSTTETDILATTAVVF